MKRFCTYLFVEGGDEIWKPLSHLFKLIYTQNNIPDQRKVAKTIPLA